MKLQRTGQAKRFQTDDTASIEITQRRKTMMLFYKEIESAVGKLKLVASSNALVAVLWERERPNRVKLDTARLDPQQPILLETERQLKEYFSQESSSIFRFSPTGASFRRKSGRP